MDHRRRPRVTGVVTNDIIGPALLGGLVLIVMLIGFTVMQHAFAGGITPWRSRNTRNWNEEEEEEFIWMRERSACACWEGLGWPLQLLLVPLRRRCRA